MPSSIVFLFSAPCFRISGENVIHGKLSLIGDQLRFDQANQQPEWIPAHSIIGLEISQQGLMILTSFGLIRFYATGIRLQTVGNALQKILSTPKQKQKTKETTLLFANGYAKL